MIDPVAPGAPALVFVNGERLPSEGGHVSARDRGFTLADGLFETMRARDGVVFRRERHLARLAEGLRVLRIPRPAQLVRWLDEAIAAMGPGEMALRLTVTRGPGPGGLAPPANGEPTVALTAVPMPGFPEATYTRGLAATVATGRRNSRSMTAGLKTLSYTDAVVAWLDARDKHADEAIFLDDHGHCSEATASNLFVVIDGGLLTPPVSCAALPGITRGAVLELAANAGLRADERAFGLDTLLSAQEAFLTSSLRGITPLRLVDDQPIGNGAPGAITTRLRTAYAALVDHECRQR